MTFLAVKIAFPSMTSVTLKNFYAKSLEKIYLKQKSLKYTVYFTSF